MIEDRDAEEPADVDEALGQLDVGAARLGLTARVVVDEEGRVGACADEGSEDLTGVDGDRGDGAEADLADDLDPQASVEADHHKDLLVCAAEGGSGEAAEGVGVAQGLAAGEVEAAETSGEFERGGDRAGGGFADPGDLEELLRERAGDPLEAAEGPQEQGRALQRMTAAEDEREQLDVREGGAPEDEEALPWALDRRQGDRCRSVRSVRSAARSGLLMVLGALLPRDLGG